MLKKESEIDLNIFLDIIQSCKIHKNTTMKTKLIEDSGRFTHEIIVRILQLLIFYFFKKNL